jgi:hypothetical protein
MPCAEKRARLLPERERAVVVKRYPFAIRLRDRVDGETQLVRIKIDPGSKTTGIAIVTEEGGNEPSNVLVRASGFFNVQRPTGVVQSIHVRHRGYSYREPRLLPTDKSGDIRRGKI